MDEVITEDRVWMISNYAFISATTLWIADFIETLPTEINAIWQKKLTGASVLFLINRYIFLLSLIFEILSGLPGNDDNKQLVIDILEQINFQGSSAGTQFQSFSACVINISDPNMYTQCGLNSLYIEFLSTPAIVRFVIPFITLLYDIYIFGLTMRKTIGLGFKMKRQGQSSVAHVIVQDGYSYFRNIFSIFYLPNILISRLMLNLRTFTTPGTGDTLTTSQRAHFSSLHFASNQMLGNIGAPLDGGSFNEEEEEEEVNEVEIEMETIREERQSQEV
ncbi:hypothetical protein GGU10DRAFT_337353 [Lentinula aff. detonsa]|uniref:DUF6533 domain-containing protein n=1 Tax=Lentinula aff. detonsa TaxID=2804958 RepID=A0AA38K7L2_9AGAR|nr:hypothetical protein GGU10DRAFT_337353 [Lentinula aff. detonsa]